MIEVLEIMHENGYSAIPIVDAEGKAMTNVVLMRDLNVNFFYIFEFWYC